jgi:hypothetical protein
VQIKEKERQERKDRVDRYSIRRRYWTKFLDYARGKTDLHANISPPEYHWIGAKIGVRGIGLNYSVTQHESTVEVYIDRGAGCDLENKEIFDGFLADKERIETEFGAPLIWERLDGKRASRICIVIQGGYRDDEQLWPKTHEPMVDAMIRLERAFHPLFAQLKSKA